MWLEKADRAPDPEMTYAQNEQARILKEAIESLRPGYQAIIKIQQQEEIPIKEIAEAMGLSVAATKARLFHARAALRKVSILKALHPNRSGRKTRVLRFPMQSQTCALPIEKCSAKTVRLELVSNSGLIHDCAREGKKTQKRPQDWASDSFPLNGRGSKSNVPEGACS